MRSNTTFHPSLFHSFSDALNRFFHFREQGSSLQTEVLAGLTTFSTLSYILIVNPMIMAHSGMDHGALITATAVVGAIFTIMMGLWTNYPLAMAPAMGVNALLAIQVCEQMHVPWRAALGMVFYSGLLFFILSVTGLRKIVIESFPEAYKKIITAGIGVFIAFIGLRNGGLIVANPSTFVGMGDLTQTIPRMAFFGIILTVVAIYRKFPGALICSIFVLTLLGLFLPAPLPSAAVVTAPPAKTAPVTSDSAAPAKTADTAPAQTAPADTAPAKIVRPTVTTWPDRVFDYPNSMTQLVGQLDLMYPLQHIILSVPICLAILFGDLFSAVACLLAIGQMARLNDEHGNLPKMDKALAADSTAAMAGGFLGTNTPIIYIESAAGVEQGGRTGLVSIVVALCYLLALFFTPLIAIVPPVATTPALVIIGILASQGLAQIDWRDLVVASTAVITILLMAMGSAADGVALGFIVCVSMTAMVGKWRTIKPAAYVLLGIFILHFIIF